jgi:hypothetical protein
VGFFRLRRLELFGWEEGEPVEMFDVPAGLGLWVGCGESMRLWIQLWRV